mmetsp:Transcript_65506/g.104331  ORF Transcript_65506/g.104331 Transcript_65506/m.104331 type:complete len:760 (+) Transcript_65506:123-2402(+)
MIVVLLIFVAIVPGSYGGRSIVECPSSRQCEGKAIVGTKIECNSYGACDMATITQKGTLGYVACTGNHACGEASYIKAGSKVYCQGYYACVLTTQIQGSMVQCSGGYACMNAHSITAVQSIYCGGYKACPDTNMDAGRDIYCDGVNSCTGSTATSAGDIICQGTKSCLKTKLTAETGTVECSGHASCKGARMKAKTVKLTGFGSGEKTTIEAEETIASGYNSISSAEVRSRNKTRIRVQTTAEAAGTDATVVCEEGSECVVDCVDGCETLEVLSYSGSTTDVTAGTGKTTTTCDTTTSGTDGCPTIKESTDGCMDREFDVYMQHKRELIERRLALLEQEELNEIMREEEQELNDAAVDGDDIWPEIASCNRAQQCQGQQIIDNDAQCYGFESCMGSSVAQQVTTAAVGAYGEKSLMNGFIDSAGAVGCNGKDACSYTGYFTAGTTLCGAYEACAYSMQNMDVLSLDCEATQSCRDNMITVKKTAKCWANRACYNSDIVAGNNILCEGSYSCSLGDLDSASLVKCTGYGACHRAVVKAAKNVYVDGENGASEATIYAPAVRVFASYGIAGSVIDSNHTDLLVKLWADFAGHSGTILCRSGSTCKVDCETSGCKQLDLVCLWNSTCSVVPRECLRGRLPAKVGDIFCPSINQSTSLQQDAILLAHIERKRQNRVHDPLYVEHVINAMSNLHEFELHGDNQMVKQIEAQNEVNNDQRWSPHLMSWRVIAVAAAVMVVFVVCYFGKEFLLIQKENVMLYQQLE